jgi:hypothetical protein
MWTERFLVERLHEGGLLPADETPAQGLQSLQQFCKTGVRNTGHGGEVVLLVKEFFYYRVLDVFAQIYGNRVEYMPVERANFLLTTLLVCTFMIFA